jgi:preprotein translocase subunit SecA
MADTTLFERLRRYHKRLNGSTLQYDITELHEAAARIESRARELVPLDDTRLRCRWSALKEAATRHEGDESHVHEGFALVYEAIRRSLGLRPFAVQLVGALVVYRGRVAQMRTGEGKTLTAVFAACMGALEGSGVHVLTFNDYLARRDAAWMEPVYRFLGVRVGFVTEAMSRAERRDAYAADVTYLTAKEAGFDYLRDGLRDDTVEPVQRELTYAIIDEADSILIDEARVPLIIAGEAARFGGTETVADLHEAAQAVRRLEPQRDFAFDTYARSIHLTEAGLERVESLLGRGELYGHGGERLVARVAHALHAHYLLQRDRDYIVRGGSVELVDEFTGRVADRRRWPEGFQAAIEAKEGLAIRSAGIILNSIPLQHFVRLYQKRSGMSATAARSEEELREFYGLHVVVVPPNRPCIRRDHEDIIAVDKPTKHRLLVEEIERVHATKRPLLVGTASVGESEALAAALTERGIGCVVLNAKNDEREAAVVAQAGKLGAVTISTNMAGRGTDIRLGGDDERERERVRALGGLYVIGTNRHESRRIDNQLRGRAGRQGDPGSSRFFVSLQDELFLRYRLHELIPPRYISPAPDGSIEHPVVRAEIDRVQRIVEGQNLEIKKMLCTYSFLIERQRGIMRHHREQLLRDEEIAARLAPRAPEVLERLRARTGAKATARLCRRFLLHHTDRLWSGYLAEMAETREGIHFRAYGKQNPLYEYQKLAIELFEALPGRIEEAAAESLTHRAHHAGTEGLVEQEDNAPSATWTYTVSDNPFEDKIRELLGAGDTGLSAWAGLLWPLTALLAFLSRRQGSRQRSPR